MAEFPKRFLFIQTALWMMWPNFAAAAPDVTLPSPQFIAKNTSKEHSLPVDTFRINFNNVSLIEYVRFVAKITGSNFVFDEADLQFNVTIVSEEPATSENVFSALVQVLRSYNLNLLEQEGNYFITKSGAVAQIPEIIGSDSEESPKSSLSTRVFRIANANAESIAGVVRSMVSQKAQVTVFSETNELIVTDITTNIEKIASLLSILDAPYSPFEIENYTAQHIGVKDLIALAQQIVAPFAEGHPLIYVPQADLHSIFIISTPHLIERSMSVFEDLDRVAPTAENVFLYKILYLQKEEMLRAIKTLEDQFKNMRHPQTNLASMLQTARYVADSNALLFTGNQEIFAKIQEILHDIDSEAHKTSLYIYQPKTANERQLHEAIAQLITNLKKAPVQDTNLISALESASYLPASHLFTFSAPKETITRLETILPSLDTPDVHPLPVMANQFFVYTLKYKKADELLKAIADVSAHLKSSGLADQALLSTLNSAKLVPSSHAVVFTGDEKSIASLQPLLTAIDPPIEMAPPHETPPTKTGQEEINQSGYFLYPLQHVPAETVLSSLHQIASDLGSSAGSRNVVDVIKHLRPISENNSLFLIGNPAAIEQVKQLIAQYDVPATSHKTPSTVFIYKPKYIDAKELQAALIKLLSDLSSNTAIDPQLLKTVQTARYVSANHSLAFSGNAGSLELLKNLVAELDTPDAAKHVVQNLGANNFFIYKLQYVTAQQLTSSLKAITADLYKDGIEDKDLSSTIRSMKWIKETNSILFSGSETALEKVKQLLPKFDVPSLGPQPAAALPEVISNFVLYQPHYRSGEELMKMLHDFENNLRMSGVNSPALSWSINNMRWMETTCSLIISGEPDAVVKVEQLLKQFDVPTPQQALISTTERLGDTSFLIYKLQFHQGDDIRMALRKVAADLQSQASHKGQKLPVAEAIDAIQWIPVTNSLLTSGSPDVLSKVRDLIQNLDIPLKQVFIEVLILATNVTNSQSFGLSWSGRGQYRNQLSTQIGNFQSPGFTGASVVDPLSANQAFTGLNATTTPSVNNFVTPGGFDLGVIGDIILHKGKSFLTLGSFLQALESDTDQVIITNPKMIAQDSNTATIFYGQNIPFTGSYVQSSSQSITTSASLEYRNVGNNVSITPTLGNSDIVTLDISIDLSSTVGPVTGQTPSNQVSGIVTNQQNIATRVHVPDGWFVCLTGQLSDSKVHFRNQIPCLGGLPLVGLAFSNTSRTNARTHVIIFISPKIIKTFEDYKQISNNQEELFKDVNSLPVVKEEIDEGISWVKTPENE